MESFNLKTCKWHINLNSAEESLAAQEWLISQGATWCNGDSSVYTDVVQSKCLTNYHVNDKLNSEGIMHCSYPYDDPKYELKLKFKISVDTVTYPIVESEQQKQIKALEATIQMAQDQIQKIKEGL